MQGNASEPEKAYINALAFRYSKAAQPDLPQLEAAYRGAMAKLVQRYTDDLDAAALYAESIMNLQAALEKRPNDPDLLYYQGRAGGLLSKQAIDTLLAAYPRSARACQALAENYFVLRQMPDAEKQYQQALQLRPDTPNLHLELGQVYAMTSRWPQAEQQFRAEVKLQPGNAEAEYRLGEALLQQGKSRESRTELERADRLQPQMPETLYAIGKAAALDGDAAASEKAWISLLSIEKEGSLAAQAHFGLAGLYRKQGKTAEAEQQMREFQKLQAASAHNTDQ